MAKIMIASRKQAQDILSNKKHSKKITAIVSISDPEWSTPKEVKNVKDTMVLSLKFHDMEKEMLDMDRCKGWVPPSKKHVQEIIDNASDMLNSGGIILCHCHAGISRSSAAAYILKCIDLGPGKEQEAFDYLVEGRNFISPNRLMIELAQDILGNKYDLFSPINTKQKHTDIISVFDSLEELLKEKDLI